jgi:hypothetical protein
MLADINIVRQLNVINDYVEDVDTRAFALATDVLGGISGFTRQQLTTRAGQYFLGTTAGQVVCCKATADDIMRDFVRTYG